MSISDTDVILLKLRNYISQALDLFITMISNFDLFKDRIDEIIVVYYEFLKNTYDILVNYYDKKKRGE